MWGLFPLHSQHKFTPKENGEIHLGEKSPSSRSTEGAGGWARRQSFFWRAVVCAGVRTPHGAQSWEGPLFPLQAADSHDPRDVPHAAARGGPEHQTAAPGRHRALPGQGHRAAPAGRRHRSRAHTQRYLLCHPGPVQLPPGVLCLWSLTNSPATAGCTAGAACSAWHSNLQASCGWQWLVQLKKYLNSHWSVIPLRNLSLQTWGLFCCFTNNFQLPVFQLWHFCVSHRLSLVLEAFTKPL